MWIMNLRLDNFSNLLYNESKTMKCEVTIDLVKKEKLAPGLSQVAQDANIPLFAVWLDACWPYRWAEHEKWQTILAFDVVMCLHEKNVGVYCWTMGGQ